MFTEILTQKTILESKKHGKLRYTESRKAGYTVCDGYTPLVDERGVESEYAVAYSLACYDFVPGINTLKKADLGINVQIRGTPYRYGHLIIKPNDNLEHIYILTTYPDFPKFYIIGYIFGYQAEGLGEKRKDGKIWVPQSKLTPIEKLNYEKKYQENFTLYSDYVSSCSAVNLSYN